jgi:hypothetical protein
MYRLHINVKETGIMMLSAVNNGMNKRREHQIIVGQVSTLTAKFPPFKIFVTLLSKYASPEENFKYGFHSHQKHIF